MGPTPPVSPDQCRAGPVKTADFTKLIHAKCPHVYAFAYDDGVGLQVCPSTTVYTWTLFCPSGPIPPTPPPMPTPRPTPPPTPPPSPVTCNVGDSVQCPGSSSMCAGNQCCPDGSICPSAAKDFAGCPHGKDEDCTGEGVDMIA